MKDLKVLVEDSKQAARNVKEGESVLHKATSEFNEVLKTKKLVTKNGTLEPLREKEETIKLDEMSTQLMLEQAEAEIKKLNPLEPIIAKFAE